MPGCKIPNVCSSISIISYGTSINVIELEGAALKTKIVNLAWPLFFKTLELCSDYLQTQLDDFLVTHDDNEMVLPHSIFMI